MGFCVFSVFLLAPSLILRVVCTIKWSDGKEMSGLFLMSLIAAIHFLCVKTWSSTLCPWGVYVFVGFCHLSLYETVLSCVGALNVFAKTISCPSHNSIAGPLFDPCGLFGSQGVSGSVRAAIPFPNNLGPIMCSSPGSIASSLTFRSPKMEVKCVLGMSEITSVSLFQYGALRKSTVVPWCGAYVLIRCDGAPAVFKMSSIILPVWILISLIYGAIWGETTIATPDALSLLCGVYDMKSSFSNLFTGVK